MKRLTCCLITLAALALSACMSKPAAATQDADGFTIYLVRHAEKQTGSDPALTPEGEARATVLAERLQGAGIETVWSSDYRRTRQTAAPTAEALELDIQIYDAGDLQSLADQLLSDQRTALVVGHSNTTPQLAALLGGDGGTPIDEASEYDRLYVLTGFMDDKVETDIQSYGAAYVPDASD